MYIKNWKSDWFYLVNTWKFSRVLRPRVPHSFSLTIPPFPLKSCHMFAALTCILWLKKGRKYAETASKKKVVIDRIRKKKPIPVPAKFQLNSKYWFYELKTWMKIWKKETVSQETFLCLAGKIFMPQEIQTHIAPLMLTECWSKFECDYLGTNLELLYSLN